MKKEKPVKTVVGPKWVKRARQWCVTIFTYGGMKDKVQSQEWFSTEKEAVEFMDSFVKEDEDN